MINSQHKINHLKLRTWFMASSVSSKHHIGILAVSYRRRPRKLRQRLTARITATAASNDHETGKKQSTIRRVAITMTKFIGGFALLGAAFIAALPAVLSTRAGLRTALSVVNHAIPGQLDVREVSTQQCLNACAPHRHLYPLLQ
jgi:hypothetical protein